MKAKVGDFVRIHNIVLKVGERADNLPEDTKKVPLEMWNGQIQTILLEKEAEIGEEVEVITITGRKVKGILVEINPVYRHNYGEFVPEILQIGLQARKILFGGENNE